VNERRQLKICLLNFAEINFQITVLTRKSVLNWHALLLLLKMKYLPIKLVWLPTFSGNGKLCNEKVCHPTKFSVK